MNRYLLLSRLAEMALFFGQMQTQSMQFYDPMTGEFSQNPRSGSSPVIMHGHSHQSPPMVVVQPQPVFVQQQQPVFVQQHQPVFVQRQQPVFVQQPQPVFVQQHQPMFVPSGVAHGPDPMYYRPTTSPTLSRRNLLQQALRRELGESRY
jgi:hypothetical protein